MKYHEKYCLQEMKEEEGGKQRAFIVILGVSRDTFCFRRGDPISGDLRRLNS